MKLENFKYKKKNTEELKDYNLLVLREDDEHISGINLEYLTPEETESVKNIQLDYEQKLQPYLKAYRSFIKENIIDE